MLIQAVLSLKNLLFGSLALCLRLLEPSLDDVPTVRDDKFYLGRRNTNSHTQFFHEATSFCPSDEVLRLL